MALALAALALPRAAALLARRRPDVVLGAGGYVAGPVALAAWLTRRPLMLMEADSHLGVANRLAAPLARRVALAFPLAGPHRAPLPRHRPPGEPGGDLGHAHRRAARLRHRPRARPRCWWWAAARACSGRVARLPCSQRPDDIPDGGCVVRTTSVNDESGLWLNG